LLWPQGLASDTRGNLYLANTGHYEVLKISTDWPIVDECVQAPHDAVMLHQHGKPTGIGKFNVMRSVCVIGDRVFVPGHIENAITVYDLEGRQVSVVSGLLPLWSHTLEPVHSLSDFAYGALEDVVFVGPYQICAAEGEEDVYFISEPFASSVIKVRIPRIQGDEDALLMESVGHRRDDQDRSRSTSQFNCMTSVIGFKRERRMAPREAQAGGNWIDQWARTTAWARSTSPTRSTTAFRCGRSSRLVTSRSANTFAGSRTTISRPATSPSMSGTACSSATSSTTVCACSTARVTACGATASSAIVTMSTLTTKNSCCRPASASTATA